MKRPRISLSTAILLSLGTGILVGIFFGESVGFLSIVGDAFIKLLQMTVLPYVMVALIAGLGSLDFKSAGAIFKYGGMAVLALWLLTVLMVVVMPLAFPDWESANFFSTALIAEPETVDILGLYIPSNPFFSLANNIVPAVVLFSIALGIALMGVPGKEGFLENIKVLAAGLTSITNFVIRLTPIGVFAIAAAASGTLQPADLEMLQVYGAIYVLMALVLAFWALPALVTSAMPLRYREIIVGTRDVLITAFATGSVFVILPLLAERTKQLLGGLVPEDRKESADSLVDVVVPTAFAFPSVGTVLILSFVLFAGWLSGTPVALAQYPVFIVSGVLSVFGGVYVGIPFMLDMMRIPADTFNLLVIFNQMVSSRFGAMLASISILTITLLCAGAVGGLLNVRLRGLIRYVVVTGVLLAVSVIGVRVFFEQVVAHQYAGYQLFIDLELEGEPVEATVRNETIESFPPADTGETAVERIRGRGTIRVGYVKDKLPFAFINSASHLVGLDVEMAYFLARDLGVGVEFVRLEGAQMAGCLDAGYCDIVMSGTVITTERAEKVSFSTPYMDQTLAFIVPDARRDEFNSREAVRRLRGLRIGMPDVPYFVRMVKSYLPDATIVPLETPRVFFRDESLELDALVYTAEAGSAWCLVYPQFTVAVPSPDVVAVPLAYPVARGQKELLELVNTWVELKKRDGTIRRAYDHWILGKGAQNTGPRWCVIRDVLHWVD